MEEQFTSLINKALPDFIDLGDQIGNVSEKLVGLLKGTNGLSDVGGALNKLAAPFDNNTASGAVGNAANGASLAKSLGLSEAAQLGAAAGSIVASIFQLPPALGQAVGAALGELVTVLRKSAKIRFDQSLTDGEQAYDRDLASYEKRGITRTTEFGEFGVSDATKRFGRAKEETKRAIQTMLDTAEAADGVIFDLLSDAQVENAKIALGRQALGSGNKSKDSEAFLDDRLNIQIGVLGQELQDLIPATANYAEKLQVLQTIAIAADEWAPALNTLGLNLGNTKDAMTATAFEIGKSAGGIDQFLSAYQNYTNQLYTPVEQLALRQEIATDAVNKYNETLTASGGTAINSKEQLKLYIEDLRTSGALQTEAGRQALIAALAISGLRTVPAPTNISGTSARTASIALIAASVLKVISITSIPPANKAFAVGTASYTLSNTTTGTNPIFPILSTILSIFKPLKNI